MKDRLKKLIAIPSITGEEGCPSMPFGSEVNNALEYVLTLCESFSFRTKNCDGMVGYAEIGEGRELVGILCHLDVVPPGSGWSHDPFGGEECGGKLYGRGAVDDKGPAMAAIFAMKEILDSGIRLNKRVRIIFGLQEETGNWPDMEYYKQHEELPTVGFTPDSKFPAIYCEKGIMAIELVMPLNESGIKGITGGEAINMVADFAQCTVLNKIGEEISLVENGKSAHGSRPEEGDNAISKLMNKLYDLDQSGIIDCALARFYMEKIGFCLDGERMGCNLYDRQSGRLTCNVGKIHMEEKRIHLGIDIRYPITYNYEQILDKIRNAVAPYGIAVNLLNYEHSVYMDKDGDIISKLVSAYYEVTGDMSEPEIIGGGTYARAMDNIVAFGPAFPGEERMEHKKDEFIVIDDLYKIKEIYKQAIIKLAQ